MKTELGLIRVEKSYNLIAYTGIDGVEVYAIRDENDRYLTRGYSTLENLVAYLESQDGGTVSFGSPLNVCKHLKSA